MIIHRPFLEGFSGIFLTVFTIIKYLHSGCFIIQKFLILNKPGKIPIVIGSAKPPAGSNGHFTCQQLLGTIN